MSQSAKHSYVEDVQGIAFGVCMAAVGMHILTYMGFIAGQTTGVAALISYATGWPFALVYFIISLPFLWLGYRRMGAVFTAKTFVSVALLSVAIAILPRWLSFSYISAFCSASQPLRWCVMAAALVASLSFG